MFVHNNADTSCPICVTSFTASVLVKGSEVEVELLWTAGVALSARFLPRNSQSGEIWQYHNVSKANSRQEAERQRLEVSFKTQRKRTQTG